MPSKISFLVPWNQATCRKIINHLKDGKPPPVDAIEMMSVGYEEYLGVAKNGLEAARQGGNEILILEGSYGIGKSHLLNLIAAIAADRNFIVKRVEVGSGRVYFNNPRLLYQQVLCGEKGPTNYEYHKYAPYYNDNIRRFIAGLELLATRHYRRGAAGLVVLVDELENTFSSLNLPNFRSRAKAYGVLDALFRGGVDAQWFGQSLARAIHLEYLFIALAITPGTLEAALKDGPIWGYYNNPAQEWDLPKREEISPLTLYQALELAKRIRAVHRVAFEWPADQFVSDELLSEVCNGWVNEGASRNDRRLVRSVIDLLEIKEQNM